MINQYRHSWLFKVIFALTSPPEIMMSEGLRFSSFKHLWSENFHLLYLFFSAGLSLFAFLSFNKWWWWCRVDGDTVNRKKHILFLQEKNEVTNKLAAWHPIPPSPTLPGCRWIDTIGDTFAFTSKDLGRFTSLAWGTQVTEPSFGKFKAIYPIFLEGMLSFFKPEHVEGTTKCGVKIMNQTTNCFRWRITVSYQKNPNATNPSVWTDPRYPPASPKKSTKQQTDQPQGSSTKNLSNLSSVVRGSHD